MKNLKLPIEFTSPTWNYYNLCWCIHTYIHTYIIGHYNPSVRVIDLVPHTTYALYFNFIHKWRNLQFKVDSEGQILRNFSWQFLFTLRVFARNLLRRNPRRNIFFHISFCCLTWDTNLGFASNKWALYLIDYGDLQQNKMA